MANPDLAFGALAKPSRYEEKADKRAVKEANWRVVSKQVDRRDNYRCRCCGQPTNPEAVDLLERGHRHHLTYRSKGGNDVASNVLSLCARCHDAEHRHRLRIEVMTAYGADGPCSFWRTDADGQEYLSRREVRPGHVERD